MCVFLTECDIYNSNSGQDPRHGQRRGSAPPEEAEGQTQHRVKRLSAMRGKRGVEICFVFWCSLMWSCMDLFDRASNFDMRAI